MKREHIWVHHELDAKRYWKQADGGYADRMSAKQGESLDLHISNSRSYYDVQIFREGARRELMTTIEDLCGAMHEIPERGYEEGFGWPVATTLNIPDDWRSGVYIAQFPSGQGIREIFFVVRPREPRSPMLLTMATNTYAAYNNVGGKCFYTYISTDREQADVVSFQRPLQSEMLGNFYIWDQFFVAWLDSEGYEVDYAINADHDAEPDLLSHYKANLRIGHDEYNSRGECEQLQQFVKNGGNFILFAGNCFCHEVNYLDDFTKLRCYKPHYHDMPTPENPETQFWVRKENMRQRTIGVTYSSFVHAKTDTPGKFFAPVTDDGKYGHFQVCDSTHWLYEGTGLEDGDEFGREDSIAGGELDAAEITLVDGKPAFTGNDGVSTHYRILAIADAKILDDRRMSPDGSGTGGEAEAYGTVAINETEFEGTIFNAATVEWGHGLYRDDSPVVQMTRNVLNRLGR